MGLGLSLAIAFMFTQGMKNLFGRPRPNLLDRCDPDLSESAIAANIVGAYARGFAQEWVLVGAGICRQTDSSILDDGFRSFPSGHSSSMCIADICDHNIRLTSSSVLVRSAVPGIFPMLQIRSGHSIPPTEAHHTRSTDRP